MPTRATPVAKRAAAPKAVHRPLTLATPIAKGPDVKDLQQHLKAGLALAAVDWLPVKVDGELGPQTIYAARFYTWVLGLGKGHRESIQKRHTIAEATQKLIRNPGERSKAEVRRAKSRRTHLAKIRKAQDEGAKAAVAYARSFIGTTENPAGSNTGPTLHNAKGQPGGVSFWEAYWGLGACFWCLCFASYCAKAIGGAAISGNCTYSVAIEGYARNHENGFIEVAYADRKPGDQTIWKFEGPDALSDHGELYVGNDQDVGGNTSSEGGSQSNGGGVFLKTLGSDTRPLSELSMLVRPLYKP